MIDFTRINSVVIANNYRKDIFAYINYLELKFRIIIIVDTGANGIGRPLMMGDETIGMGELNRFKREVL